MNCVLCAVKNHSQLNKAARTDNSASLALAETVAGLGSMILCKPDEIVVGMQVSGNHISSAHEGDTVRAVATIVHKGRSSHVWNVDVFTSTAKLVSSVRVVNSILKKG